jgi:peptidoglycan/LPS O-acetylase OafA/YrhL
VIGHAAAPAAALVLVLLSCSIPTADISGWPRLLIHASLALLVASCVVQEQHVLAPALSLWAMRRIGAVSYGIYLYHHIVRHLVEKASASAGLSSQLVYFVGTALGTWAAAELSYWAFESRLLALKARWS